MNGYSPVSKSSDDPIQEQLAQARQHQILQAAINVFAEKGFHRATIRDIAKAAGIADGTIYIYFENKTALLLGILNLVNESEQREDDLAQAETMDVREFFRAYVSHRLSVLSDDGLKVMRVLLPEVMTDAALRQHYMEQIIAPTFGIGEKHFQ